jgi:beta-galactosidase
MILFLIILTFFMQNLSDFFAGRKSAWRLFVVLLPLWPFQVVGQFSLDQLNAYIENPAMVAENQEPPHVPLMPFSAVNQALTHDWKNSPYFYSLNGQWKFSWTINPLEAPQEFYRSDFEAGNWPDINVPGTWQMQGWGHNVYRNIPMEFGPYDPPYVPDFINPTGSYIKTFTLPANWQDRNIFLHFEGVKSAYWVWLNGEYVGFDKGSMTPGEFNITPFVRPGENKLAVRVVRWSDGSYLEDQDMWRFSGIYRGVYLFSMPKVFIRDVQVVTDLDGRYRDASLRAKVAVRNTDSVDHQNVTVRARLFDRTGNEVTAVVASLKSLPSYEERLLVLKKPVYNPDKWSAEKPNLYSLTLELFADNNTLFEVLEQKVGFRELEIRDGILLVNGVPIKIKGTNRHEHDSYTGRTMSRERIIQDLTLMKRLNINAIRTSHYPNDPMLYDLTDEFGFYVCDEVNAECHYGESYLAWQPGWEKAFMDRTERYVQRDKNHPSVVMWSMGNECGLAPIHFEMAKYCRAADSTRFIYHQTNEPNGDAPFADICGTRYPSPAFLDFHADTSRRPIIMGEYDHSMGNGGGHLDEYWEIIYRHKNLSGGFIWDWVNQGLQFDLLTTQDESPYHHQTVLMGRPRLVEGKNGNGLLLSGIDDWVEVYPHPIFQINGNELTLECWVKPRGFIGSNSFITKGEHGYALEQNDRDSLTFSITTERRYVLSTFLPRDWNNNWHHIAGIYDGTTMYLYIDGEIVASQSAQGNIARSIHPVCIGKNHERHHEQFPGFLSNAIIDEVHIYRTALPERELGFFRKEPLGKDLLLLSLDFETTHNEGTFLSYGATPQGSGTIDGIVFADRTPQPEAWQVKKSQQPVFVKPMNVLLGKVRIENRFHFTNLNELDTRWQLLGDDRVIESGRLDLDIAPLDYKDVVIPFSLPEPKAGVCYRLVLSFLLKDKTSWAEKGYEVAFSEIVLPIDLPSENKPKLESGAPLTVTENASSIIIAGDDFLYRFDKSSGDLRLLVGGAALIEKGPRLNVWRTPIMNERSEWGISESSIWYDLGLDTLGILVRSVSQEKLFDNAYRIVAEIKSFSQIKKDVAFNHIFEYTFLLSGDILIDHRVRCSVEMPGYPNRDVPWLAKLGLQFEIPESMTHLKWFGRGPFETYPDRKTAARIGLYETLIENIKMPYLIPQDFDNRTDVRWCTLTDDNGSGFAVFSNSVMNVSIDPYENMQHAWYPFQLRRKKGFTLNIDHKVTGVGGTSIQVQSPYRTYPDEYYYRIRIRPVTKFDDVMKMSRMGF